MRNKTTLEAVNQQLIKYSRASAEGRAVFVFTQDYEYSNSFTQSDLPLFTLQRTQNIYPAEVAKTQFLVKSNHTFDAKQPRV